MLADKLAPSAALVAFAINTIAGPQAQAQSAQPFYNGKNISLISGFAPGVDLRKLVAQTLAVKPDLAARVRQALQGAR